MGLALLGPSPVSLCAMASPLFADCAPTGTQPHCADMDMGEQSSTTLALPTAPCCVSSQAPLPEAKNDAPKPAARQVVVTASVLNVETLNPDNGPVSDSQQDPSPPPLQSLLCIFLN